MVADRSSRSLKEPADDGASQVASGADQDKQLPTVAKEVSRAASGEASATHSHLADVK